MQCVNSIEVMLGRLGKTARPQVLPRLLSLGQQQQALAPLSSGAVTTVKQSSVPTTNSHGAAFPDDLRSTSGLGRTFYPSLPFVKETRSLPLRSSQANFRFCFGPILLFVSLSLG